MGGIATGKVCFGKAVGKTIRKIVHLATAAVYSIAFDMNEEIAYVVRELIVIFNYASSTQLILFRVKVLSLVGVGIKASE